MPLSMVKEGEPNVIKKVGGKEETRRFLENLGFVAGGTVTVVSEVNGNKIYHVSEILRYACAIILAIAVWRNGFK